MSIERVETVERVQSLTTANVVTALPETSAEDAGGIEVNPLVPEQVDAAGAAVVKSRALGDRLMRGDLVSDDGRVTAIIVSFDESRIDEVRGGVIQKIHEVVDPRLPAGLKAYYNGSLEISESYNRVTLDNLYYADADHPRLHAAVDLFLFRSVTQDAAGVRGDPHQRALDDGALHAARVLLQRAQQHTARADCRPRRRRRRAHRAALRP